jgi:hypothetical protein
MAEGEALCWKFIGSIIRKNFPKKEKEFLNPRKILEDCDEYLLTKMVT